MCQDLQNQDYPQHHHSEHTLILIKYTFCKSEKKNVHPNDWISPEMTENAFTINSLYIAGFSQARAPHLGLLLSTSQREGILYHIYIDREMFPTWQFQRRKQIIDKDMFLSSLLRIHDSSVGIIDDAQMIGATQAIPAPQNDTFGECKPWIYRVVKQLHDSGLLELKDADALSQEVEAHAIGSNDYARRDKFPNVAVSKNCR
jgi:hypothetical protein